MPQPPLTPLAAATLHVPRNPERILEIGCGDGDAVLFLSREFPAARIRGVDRSEESIRRAVARVGLDPEGRVAFKQGKPASLPYPDGFFDLVVQLDARPSLGEIVRVLRPGGLLILAVSDQQQGPLAFRPAKMRRRLRRRGIGQVEVGTAGDGNFFVGRLGDEV